MVHMAERGSRDTGSDGGEVGHRGTSRRVVALRTLSRPQPAVAPAWAGAPGERTGAWSPEPPRSAPSGGGSAFPSGAELPHAPDPEAAAFLNAPRRPLGFYVAPFGTPPFGNPPTGGDRSVFGGPLGPDDGRGHGRRPGPAWGPAYPAGA